MQTSYCMLDLVYSFHGARQHLYPTVLFYTHDVVLIDCGYPDSVEQLENQLLLHGIHPEALTMLVLTHQDDDHIGSAAAWKAKYPAIQLAASALEAPYISGTRKNLRLSQAEALQSQLPKAQQDWGMQFCARLQQLQPAAIDRILHAGDTFSWGGGCEILATPGHTPGHISIRSLRNDFLITGDAAVPENGQLAIANPEFCLDLNTAQHSLKYIQAYHCPTYLCYHGGILQP